MNLSNLKQLRQWVGYTSQKIPISPQTGKAASSNDPATWGTAAEAWRLKQRQGLPGIGYMFTIAAGVVGIDLDDCFEGDNLKPYARDIVQCMNSYTEFSPSGRGLHVLARGTIPHSVKPEGGGFEMYNELRYFTVTGREFGASEFVSSDIEERPSELLALFVTYGGDLNDPPPLPSVPNHGIRTTTEGDVKRALDCLPSQGDYNTQWLPALMAVHDAFPDERGVQLIEQWSPGYPGEVRRKFRSFDKTSKSGITIASLFHMAKQYGYKPRQANRPAQNKNDLRSML